MALNDPRKGYQRLIGQAALSLKAELEAAFLAAGYQLTAPQWTLLHSLDQREGVSQNEIAQRAPKTRPTSPASWLRWRKIGSSAGAEIPWTGAAIRCT